MYLFKLLFINDLDLMMKEVNDFYKEIYNEKKVRFFLESIGIDLECVKVIFLDLFFYIYGIVVLIVIKKLILDRYSVEKMLKNILIVFIR